MKKTILFVLLITVAKLWAQTPPMAFNYQAVIRDAGGNVMPNTQVQIWFSILTDSLNGNRVYIGTALDSTNQFGVFTAKVGADTSMGAHIEFVDWSTPKFLKVEAKIPATSSTIVDMGTTQLLSVPYALYSGKAANVARKFQTLKPNIIYSDSVRNATVILPDSLVVEEAGMYCVMFNVAGGNSTASLNVLGYDYSGKAHVFSNNAGIIISPVPLFKTYYDIDGINSYIRYMEDHSSASSIVYLTAGDVLHAAAFIQSIGTPSGTWWFGPYSIELIKLD